MLPSQPASLEQGKARQGKGCVHPSCGPRPVPARKYVCMCAHACMRAQAWLSCITNVFLFSFSSEQLYHWLPRFFDLVEHTTEAGERLPMLKPQYVNVGMGVLFAAEHLLLLLSVLITFAIDDVPKAVKVRPARRFASAAGCPPPFGRAALGGVLVLRPGQCSNLLDIVGRSTEGAPTCMTSHAGRWGTGRQRG